MHSWGEQLGSESAVSQVTRDRGLDPGVSSPQSARSGRRAWPEGRSLRKVEAGEEGEQEGCEREKNLLSGSVQGTQSALHLVQSDG